MMFIEVFRRRGVDVTEAEVRTFMVALDLPTHTGLTFAQGMGKKEHLAKMLGLSRIAKEWEQRHGVALRHAP